MNSIEIKFTKDGCKFKLIIGQVGDDLLREIHTVRIKNTSKDQMVCISIPTSFYEQTPISDFIGFCHQEYKALV